MINLKGMRCPQPLIELKLAMRAAQHGESIFALIDDPTSKRDIPKYLKGKEIEFTCATDAVGDLILEVRGSKK